MERHLKLFSPKPPFPSGFFLRFYQHRLEFLEELAGSNCPVAFFQFAGEKMYLVNEPELIKDVLVSNYRRFKKGRGLERAKIILWEGLLTSEGEIHRRQRRIVQPVFQHRYLQNYADIMVDHTIKLCSSWNDGTRISYEPGSQDRRRSLRSSDPHEPAKGIGARRSGRGSNDRIHPNGSPPHSP